MSLHLDSRRLAMLAEMGVHLPPAALSVNEPIAVEPEAVRHEAMNQPTGIASSSDVHSPEVLAVRAPAPRPSVRPAPTESAPAAMSASAPLASRPPSGPVADLSWSALQETVAHCEACNLCQQRRNTVFGTGAPEPAPGEAPQVDWMIVGEAPGEHEDAQGEPFVGQAGRLLDNMLKAVGLERHADSAPGGRVYIANVLKCRPPGNRNPQPQEVAQCEPYLARQVALVRPKIILAMGRFAVQSLLKTDEPIGRLRGRVHRYEGVPVIVTYHPAYLLRTPADKAKAWADLCLAMETANTPLRS